MNEKFVIKSPKATLVKSVNVAIGQNVKYGDVLATLDDETEQISILKQRVTIRSLEKALSEFSIIETDRRISSNLSIKASLENAKRAAKILLDSVRLAAETGAARPHEVADAIFQLTSYEQQVLAAKYQITKIARSADQGIRSLNLMLTRANEEIKFSQQSIARLVIKAPVNGRVQWIINSNAPISLGGTICDIVAR
jgi:multidrug resistance efflux pump